MRTLRTRSRLALVLGWTSTFLASTALAVGIAASVVPAYAQSRPDRPDFRITKATFNGRDLHVEYVNATGVGYPRVRYEVGFQWYDVAGKPVGERHWLPVPEVERGGVAILDTAYRIDLTYRRTGGNYNRRLLDFVLQRPNVAEELRVTVDDGDRVFETDESNNVARLRIPLPDLQITGAKFLSSNRLELSYRNANPSPILLPFRIGVTWAAESGTYLTPTRWINVLEPRDGATETVVLSRTDASYITPQNQQAGDRLDWYFERRPGNATRLQVTMDDAGTVREANEQNNLVSVRPFLPDLVVRDAKLDGSRLTFTYGNAGEGYIRDSASRVVFQWIGASGKPVAEPRWSGFAQMDPGQTFIENADRFDVTYAVAGTTRTTTQRLAAYLAQRPADAVQLRIAIDDEERILEANEENNAATVVPPPLAQPDFSITDATFTADALGFTVRNLGSGIAPPGQPISLWFEWVDASGSRVGALAWVDARSAIAPGQFLRFTGAYSRFARERAGGGTEFVTLADLLAGIPETATHLKVHADGPNAIREADEANNIVLLAMPVLPKPDLEIRGAQFAFGRLSFTAVNSGARTAKGPVSFWLEWVNADGERELGPFWFDVAKDLAPGTAFAVDSAKLRVWGVALRGSGRIEEHDAGLILGMPPAGVVALKVRVDGPNRIAEENEENNSASIAIPWPDLTITDAHVNADGTIRFTVKNAGKVAVPTVDVRAQWVAGDGTLVSGEGKFSVGPLNAGESSMHTAQSAFPKTFPEPTEARTLRITTDPANAIIESNEENNGAEVQVEPQPPDLVLASIERTDGALTVKMWNRGNGGVAMYVWELQWEDASGKLLGEPLRRDGIAMKPGYWNSIMIDAKDTGRGSAYDVFFGARPTGAVRVRATVDPDNAIAEIDETNNAKTWTLPLPDLSFRDVTYTEDGGLRFIFVNTGDQFPDRAFNHTIELRWLDATNNAIGSSYELSAESRFPRTGFTQSYQFDEGNMPRIPFFSNVSSNAERLRITLDSRNTVQEQREDNNTSVIAVPRKRAEADHPDLTVGAVEVRDGALRITAMNIGGAASAATDIWFMWFAGSRALSSSAAVDLPAIAAGAETTVVVPLNGKAEASRILSAPPREGTRVRVALDGSRKVDDLNRGNNDAYLDRGALPAPREAGLPDLRIAAFTFDPKNPAVGELIRFDARVENAGTASVGMSTLARVMVDDRNDGTTDAELGSYAVPDLAAGKFATYRWTGRGYEWKAVAGTHAFTLCLDQAGTVRESNEENNCERRVVTVGTPEEDRARLPDLAYRPPRLLDASAYRYAVQVDNLGEAASPGYVWELQWVDDHGKPVGPPHRRTYDRPLPAGGAVGDVIQYRASGTISAYDRYTLAPPIGAAQLRLAVDPENRIVERNEENNAIVLDPPPKEASKPKPEPATPKEADLRVERIVMTPAAPSAGDMLTFAVTVKNAGGMAVGASAAYLAVDLGNDEDPESAPDPLDAPPLAAGATQVLTWRWEDRAVAGTNRVDVCVDVADDIEEANDDNNCRSQTFTVRGSGAAADGTSAFAAPFDPLRAVLGWWSE